MPDVVRLSSCLVDLPAHTVVGDDGEEVSLTAIEAKLLDYLVEHHGRVLSRDELLQEVWGYREGVRSRTVDTTVRRLRAKLEIDAKQPEHLVSVYGSGYRFDVPSLEVPGLHGRAEAMRDLLDATRGPWTSLVGTAGVGKTALAQAWAERTPGKLLWVTLDGVLDAAGVAAAVAQAQGGALDGDGPAAVARLMRAAGVTHLVLDGVEESAGAVRELAAHVEGIRVLVTSRVPLEVDGERVVRLEPLTTDAATALFAERAEVDADAPRVRALVAKLGHLPLALVLAASWVPTLGFEPLAAQISTFDSAEVQTSVRHSLELLDVDDRRALAALACFEGEFTPAAAVAMGVSPESLVRLHRHCLLAGEEGSLRLYDAVRATVRGEGLGEEDLLRWARFLAADDGRWVADRTRALGLIDDDALRCELLLALIPVQNVFGLSRRARELSATLIGLVGEARPDLAFRAWLLRAEVLEHASEEARAAALRARELATTPAERAAAIQRYSAVAISGGRPKLALEALQAFEIEACVDPALVASLRSQTATALRLLGEPAQAVAHYEEAARVLLAHERYADAGMVLTNLGGLHMDLGRPDLSLARLEAAEPLIEEHHPNLLAVVYGNQAEALRVQGRLDDAVPLFDKAMDVVGEAPRTLCILLIQRSGLELGAGRLDKAAALATRALTDVGGDHPRYRSFALLQQGGIHQRRGWVRLAAETYERAAELMEELGDRRHLALVSARMAALLAAEDLDAARAWLAKARSMETDTPPIADAIAVYGAVVDAVAGDDVSEVIAWANAPAEGRMDPTRMAWNPEMRFAMGLLDEVLSD